jgi:hypothetical protein
MSSSADDIGIGLLPAATVHAVEGGQHNVAADVLAAALRQFASAEPATAPAR